MYLSSILNTFGKLPSAIRVSTAGKHLTHHHSRRVTRISSSRDDQTACLKGLRTGNWCGDDKYGCCNSSAN